MEINIATNMTVLQSRVHSTNARENLWLLLDIHGPVRRNSTMRFHACAALFSVSMNKSFLESIVLVSLQNT